MTVVAIVVSGGSGQRFGRDGGKQLIDLGGRPLFAWAVAACAGAPAVDRIIVVSPRDRAAEFESAAREAAGDVELVFAESGDTRQDSVASGLASADDADVVIVHDGARPLATAELIENSVVALMADPSVDGVIVAHPSVDTVKSVVGDVVTSTPARESLWVVQTPQTFRAAALRDAFARARADGFVGTDESSLVERAGGTVRVIEGPRDNLKVTRPEDLPLAQAALRRRVEGER